MCGIAAVAGGSIGVDLSKESKVGAELEEGDNDGGEDVGPVAEGDDSNS